MILNKAPLEVVLFIYIIIGNIVLFFSMDTLAVLNILQIKKNEFFKKNCRRDVFS